jgi:methylenetetrahydrofolate dehydrogenase (NADP+)/methenyltetrahydrofolate cyclohydrolase
MSARILDGKALAATYRARLKEQIATSGLTPCLAVVLVGDNSASESYIRGKVKACAEVGIISRVVRLPITTTNAVLDEEIQKLNDDPEVHGILLQLPLPSPLEPMQFMGAIDPAKDVDGFHPVNAGLLATGLDGFVPCTPLGCVQLMRLAHENLRGLHVVVLGRSLIVGRPLGQLLLRQDCTVTMAHSKSANIPSLTHTADIVVAAMGQPHMVKADWIKPGATVIDVGLSRVDGKLLGDIDFAAVSEVAGAITPVPGGVGPMTIVNLLANTVRAAMEQTQ